MATAPFSAATERVFSLGSTAAKLSAQQERVIEDQLEMVSVVQPRFQQRPQQACAAQKLQFSFTVHQLHLRTHFKQPVAMQCC